MKRVHKIRGILFLIFVLSVAHSCANEIELALISQEERIDSYLATTFKDSTIIRNGGSNVVILESDESKPLLEYGDSLIFYYAGYIFDSRPSSLFDTNLEAVATQSRFQRSEADYSAKRVLFEKGYLLEGLEKGLIGRREGDHLIIVFSAKYGYGNTKHYNIPKLSALAYEVWIESIIKEYN